MADGMSFSPGLPYNSGMDPVTDQLGQPYNGGMDFQYPTPLFISNTFLEVRPDRPASLEGFYQDREAYSCPTSGVSNGEPARVMPRGPRRYCPGEVLTRTALLDTELPLGATVSSVPPGQAEILNASKMSADCMSLWPRTAQEPTSQCSTVDSAQEAHSKEYEGSSSTSAMEYEGLPPDAELGSPAFPSVGSKAHYYEGCKPCAFMYKDGCRSGVGCSFCHLCEPGEKKRRKKEKQTVVKQVKLARSMLAAGQMAPWSGYFGRR